MDRAWAAEQLQKFRNLIDVLARLASLLEAQHLTPEQAAAIDALTASHGSYGDIVDRLVSLEPVMRDLMEAAQPGLGNYADAPDGGSPTQDSMYWSGFLRNQVLRAIGIYELGEEARRRMQPDSPDLAADQLHPWVWEAASPMWDAGSTQAAVLAAAQSVNARLQQKLGRHDASDAALCRESFSRNDPVPGQPRLRFPGDRASDTWRSRQNGGVQFGAGCFEGLRNPAAHEHELQVPEQVALEQLAAFSVLARWVDECTVETVGGSDEVGKAAEGLSEMPGTMTS
jgi:hypothetical protein